MSRSAVAVDNLGRAGGIDDPFTAATTLATDAATADTDLATAFTDFDTAMAALVTTTGVVTYSSTTHQFSGTYSTVIAGTEANANALLTALNAAGTALIAAKAATAAAKAAGLVPALSTSAALILSADPAQNADKSVVHNFAVSGARVMPGLSA